MELHQRVLLNGRRPLLRAAALAVLATAVALPSLAASPEALPALAQLTASGARVSAAVWDLDRDQLIAQLGATERLIPASLSKIVIAAAALDTWAPDHDFPTELRSLAAPVDGVLNGNLILRGSGDATLDETTLWALAAQLRGAGVRQVTGAVLVERAPFGELDCDTVDRCAGLRRSARAYNAAPGAIGVNYGSWCIAVRAPIGARNAQVGGCATGEMPIPLSGTVQVAPGGAALRVERITEGGNDRIAVGGNIASGDERQVHRAMSDPAAGTGQILRSILRQTGVRIDGGVETAAHADARATQLLAAVNGLPLQEQLGRMMRYSNNYIADVLTMGVALTREGRPPRSLAEAAQTLVRFMATTPNSAQTGVPTLDSGSGLTTSNRLSALDLLGVLQHEYRDSRRFPAFYGSFLHAGGADWLDRVALKTGSLTDPVSVNGVAGYLRKKSGGWMAFAIIVNGSERLRQIPHEQALRAARADLEALLAQY
jgi:serine-type D-Ala-D-Ala carboxypeptidase/endopeptidase (penicillin-binding protein 4)